MYLLSDVLIFGFLQINLHLKYTDRCKYSFICRLEMFIQFVGLRKYLVYKNKPKLLNVFQIIFLHPAKIVAKFCILLCSILYSRVGIRSGHRQQYSSAKSDTIKNKSLMLLNLQKSVRNESFLQSINATVLKKRKLLTKECVKNHLQCLNLLAVSL